MRFFGFFDRSDMSELIESFVSGARRWSLLAVGFVCLILAFGLVMTFQGRFTQPDALAPNPPEFEEDTYEAAPAPLAPLAAYPETEEAESDWVVYITGAVKRPGVYEVAPGSRVNDALAKAGGFSSYADPEAVNLASRLEDGVHIRFPSRNEQEKAETYAAASSVGNSAGGRDSNTVTVIRPPAPRVYAPPPGDGRIDINSADAGELEHLPGIGPHLAAAVVAYREKNGPFERADDLMLVRGIGPKRFEAIRDLVRVTKHTKSTKNAK